MLDDASRDILQQIVRREGRSFLQYVREVPIWSSSTDRPNVAQLKTLATAELEKIDEIGRLLVRRKCGLAFLGAYPSAFTTFNDAALRHILPQVINECQRSITTLQAELEGIQDAEARELVSQFVELKRTHLPQFTSLATQPHTIF